MTTNEHKLAIVNAGGKQHVARVGKKIIVNQVAEKEGDSLNLTDVLTNQPIQLKVVRHFLGDKVNGLKFKNKVRYLKRYGHRQKLSELEVISFNEKPKAEPKKAEAKPKAVKKASKKEKNG